MITFIKSILFIFISNFIQFDEKEIVNNEINVIYIDENCKSSDLSFDDMDLMCVIDSTFDTNCKLSTVLLSWDSELSGGYFFLRILPDLVYVGVLHDNPNPNRLYFVRPITKQQYSLIINGLKKRDKKVFLKSSWSPRNEKGYVFQVDQNYLYKRYNLPENFDEKIDYLGSNYFKLLSDNIINIFGEIDESLLDSSSNMYLGAINADIMKKTKINYSYSEPCR